MNVVGKGDAGYLRTIPVVDECAKHCTGFPPVIRLRQETWRLACLVARVVAHHAVGESTRCGLDGVWQVALADEGRKGGRWAGHAWIVRVDSDGDGGLHSA